MQHPVHLTAMPEGAQNTLAVGGVNGLLAHYLPPLIASLALLIYFGVLLRYFPDREEIGYVSLGFKGILAMMGTTGLFLLADMRKAEHRAYTPLFTGLLCFAVAFTTDSSAEIVRTTLWLKIICERMVLVIGFAFVLRGLYLWSHYTMQVNASLAHLATTDDLTGVSNRRHLLQELRKQTATTSRQPGHLLCAIMFDLDHFKRINDDYGHEEGDRVLRDVTRSVGKELRTVDVLARTGGEEFVVLLPATGLDGALKLAERLRSVVKYTPFGASDRASASFGVAMYQAGETETSFLRRLDVALYQSKEQGRDRVTVYNT